jgi:cell division protease FtsH
VIVHADFEHAMDRVIAGLQQRRVITDKEKRILAYHEGGHALMAHLMSAVSPVQKATIIARGTALGYTLNLPEEERYLHTKEELVDWMVVTLAGRAAEQVVFGRVTNGAANDLEKVTELARSMVFEYGMGDSAVARTMRADNYALSEETKRMRDTEQARLTDQAYARRSACSKHRVRARPRRDALLEKETLARASCSSSSATSSRSRARSETVGVVRRAERRGVGRVAVTGIHHVGIASTTSTQAIDTTGACSAPRSSIASP